MLISSFKNSCGKIDITINQWRLVAYCSVEASCILQRDDPCSASDSIDKITLKKWKNIEDQSKRWAGLDTFESIFTTVD